MTVDGDRDRTRAERSRATAALMTSLASCDDAAEREAILRQVVIVNRGVAESVAARFRNRGIPAEDLRQVAYLGLIRAVRHYDPARAEDLLTYAVPTIRGELQRHFRDLGWTVRPTRRIQELQWRLNNAIDRLSQRDGREPSAEELQVELGVSREEYAETLAAFGCFQPVSLDRSATSSSTTTLGDLLGVEQSVDAVEARTVLRPVVRSLSERERRILYLRFFEDCTQQEIGDELGVTQMQVSRLIRRILERMRAQLEQPPVPVPTAAR